MGDYTPSTDEVRFGYAESVSPGRESQAVPGFDRWLAAHDATVRAEHEKAVRERIAQDIEAVTMGEVVYTLGGNSAPTVAQQERARVIEWFGGKSARIASEGA